MELTRLKRERAIDAVYEMLRKAILSSLFKPGERLNVEGLADKLGVSLTPVRQAIQQLAVEGLVEVRPRSGTFVANLNLDDVEETFDIRCALECMAAEKAVEKITSTDLRHLKELLKSLRKPVRNDRDRSQHELDNSELHLVLIRSSGNRRLLEMYQALNASIKIARIHATELDWMSRLREEQAEHEAIVSALENRNLDELMPALRRHIIRARDALMNVLRDHPR